MIRKAVQSDIPQIADIYEQLHLTHCKIRPDYFREPPMEHYIEDLQWSINERGFELIVFEENEMIKGYAEFYIHDREEAQSVTRYKRCFVEQFAVKDECRRLGIGKAMMERIKAFANDNGCDSIELGVWFENYDAVDFYSTMGFSPRMYKMEMKLKKERQQ